MNRVIEPVASKHTAQDILKELLEVQRKFMNTWKN